MADTNRTYADSLVCRWAEKRMGLPEDSVSAVRLTFEPAWCSEHTFERENLELTAYDEDGQVIPMPWSMFPSAPLTTFFVEDVAEALFELVDLHATTRATPI